MNLFFVYDEYTDIVDGEGAGKIRDIVMDAFRHPEKPRPEGELLLGGMAREFVSFLHFLRMSSYPPSHSSFWIRASSYASPDDHCLSHFVDGFDAYTAAVIREADDRTERKYRTFLDYLSIRRNTIACLPCFALCEFELNLPEEAVYHPQIVALREQAIDLIAIDNVRLRFLSLEPRLTLPPISIGHRILCHGESSGFRATQLCRTRDARTRARHPRRDRLARALCYWCSR